MRLPSCLLVGMQTTASYLERWRLPLLTIIVILSLAGAAFIRFQLPTAVLFNPDSWGYVGPSFIHQETGVFPQTHGRNFFYPALLHLALSPAGNPNHIAAWQHAIGLFAGILWFLLWMLWAQGFPAGWLRRWAAPMIGLAGMSVFLYNGMGLIFEHHIRPEGVFPFFAILQLLFLGGTLRAGLSGKSAFQIGGLASLAAMTALASVALKPSWTLTLGTLPLLVLVVFIAIRKFRPPLFILTGVLMGNVVWTFGIQTWQDRINWKPDPAAKLFLPQSLVSVHADLILKTKSVTSAKTTFQEEFSEAFEKSKIRIKPYELLGFNPDIIFYETPVFQNLPGSVDEKQRFLMGLYFNALRQQPLPMAQKWIRQFAVTLHPKRNWVFLRDYQLSRDFERSAADLRLRAQWENPEVASRLAGEARLADENAATLEQTTRLTLNLRPDVTNTIRSLVPLGALFSFCLGVTFLFRRESSWRTPALEGLLWCATFLAAIATVAIVHSFDIDRYAEILNFLYLLMSAFATMTLLAFLTWISSRSKLSVFWQATKQTHS